MEIPRSNQHSSPLELILFTWLVVLLVSDLPEAIWQALAGVPPAWLLWVKFGLLAVIIVSSLSWKLIRPVRSYFTLLLVLLLAYYGMNLLRSSAPYLQWEQQIGWVWGMVAFQALKLAVAFIMIAALLLMGRRPKDFFLTPGQLNIPVRAASTGDDRKKPSITWGGLGLILGICILPLTLLFFAIGNLPAAEVLVKALPFFPAAVLFAITNAFSEEMQFRAALLGDLQAAFGDDHAIWMTAAFFGLFHYFSGPPSGIPGVLVTGLLGALFAKCMLGSKGIAVPWFIHFCQNAVIYAFSAISSVA